MKRVKLAAEGNRSWQTKKPPMPEREPQGPSLPQLLADRTLRSAGKKIWRLRVAWHNFSAIVFLQHWEWP
jgi:hypothetical protein